jgi:hypothetical protein
MSGEDFRRQTAYLEENIEKKEEASVQGNSRWWEFYFVRYALGTLFGALIVNSLASRNPELREILFFASGESSEAIAGSSLLGLPILFGYGLFFCYLSSIPILVWHTGRMATWGIARFDSDNSFWSRVYGRFRTLPLEVRFAIGLFFPLWGISIFSVETFQFLEKGFKDNSFVTSLIVSSVFFIIVLEVYFVFLILFSRQKIYSGMKSLAQARHVNRNKGEFIDSYRHLREHGNSILILILEAILGGALLGIVHFFTGNPNFDNEMKYIAASSVALLTLWVLPGAFVWPFATWVEARFASDADT